jgi:soluble lytic murein transglycosylase
MGFFLKDPKFFKLYSKSQAEERILRTIPRRLSKNASKYLRAVLILCEKHQVDPFWVFSVMWTESHFHFESRSIVGARGLMQIMPGTKKFIYRNVKRRGDILAIESSNFNLNEYFPYKVPLIQYKIHQSKLLNIELGIIYLKSLLKFFSKNHTYATVAYNMGPGWTRKRLRNKLPVGVKNEYLDKVQRAYKTLAHRI